MLAIVLPSHAGWERRRLRGAESRSTFMTRTPCALCVTASFALTSLALTSLALTSLGRSMAGLPVVRERVEVG